MYYINEISALRKEFYKFYDKNNYLEAIEKGEKIVSLYRENKDTACIEYAEDMYNLAVVYDFLMLYEKSLKLYRESVEVREKLELDDSEDYANAINNMAVCLGFLDRDAEALSLHKKALAIREKDLGRNHVDSIESLLNIGNTYDDMGRLDKALDSLTKALSRAERQKELPKIEYSDILCSIARVLAKKGSLVKSIVHYSKAIDIIEAEMGCDNPYFVKILDAAAKVCADAEKYEMAIIFYEKAVEIRKKLVENNSVELIAELNFLAMTYGKNKNLEKAVEVFDFALRKVSELMDKDHIFYSDVLMNKAYAYYINGDLEQAIKFLELACAMKTKNLGDEHKGLMNVLSKLITVYIKNKDFDKAMELCDRVLSISMQDEPETRYVANAYKNFAKLYIAKENYLEAENYLLRAESLYEEDSAEKKRLSYSRIISILSEVCALNGDYDRAEKYAGKVLAFISERYGQEHPKYAYALYKLSEKMILNSQYTAGISNLEKAMAVCKDVIGTENEGYKNADELLKNTYAAVAFFYMETGDIKSASKNYEKAKDVLSGNEKAIDFAGLYLALDDINGAKEIMDKHKSSARYSIYENWIELKKGSIEAAEALANYIGLFASSINYDLAEAFNSDGQAERALSHYRKAVNGVEDEKYIKAVTAIYSDGDDADEAVLEKALSYADGRKLDKTEGYIYLIKAMCDLYYKNGNYERACDCYEKLIVLVSDDYSRIDIHIEAVANMGRICALMGKNEDAAEFLSEASMLVKNRYGEEDKFIDLLAETGEVFLRLEKADSAKAVFEKAMMLSENKEGYIANALKYADVCFDSGDIDKAIEAYENAYNICTEIKSYDLTESGALERLKDYYKANKKLDKLLKIKLGKTL